MPTVKEVQQEELNAKEGITEITSKSKDDMFLFNNPTNNKTAAQSS